ncbi:hypothetical protein PR202_ga02546 [Eleusine coracana subsp. coracana]|uniref:Uncharacterized protein n=1 Tax=Eleusine coracana subsp. coracana TaxID=191504 RepID=A0AAV5BL19_ELECO|nr:hypothetical protein PR202_ga02546 [Eleusine coracana subsp. coracana]
MVTVEPPPAAYKKATAMLDEAARARLRGLFMSGSPAPPGRADADDDLVDLVDQFYNGYDQQCMDGGVVVAKDGRAPRSSEWKVKLREILADAAANDVAAAGIRAEVERVVRDAAVDKAGGGVGVRRRLVERLQCRALQIVWEKSGSVPAPGAHEYVDVTTTGSSSTHRYIVEVNVASEFDIARPSAAYRALLRSLPAVLVATPDAFGLAPGAVEAGADAAAFDAATVRIAVRRLQISHALAGEAATSVTADALEVSVVDGPLESFGAAPGLQLTDMLPIPRALHRLHPRRRLTESECLRSWGRPSTSRARGGAGCPGQFLQERARFRELPACKACIAAAANDPYVLCPPPRLRKDKEDTTETNCGIRTMAPLQATSSADGLEIAVVEAHLSGLWSGVCSQGPARGAARPGSPMSFLFLLAYLQDTRDADSRSRRIKWLVLHPFGTECFNS